MTTTLAELFDLVEADANAAEFYTTRSSTALRRFGEWLPQAQKRRPDWLTTDDDEARLIRRVHARLSENNKPRTIRGETITVQEFADRLGVSRSTADRLLADGRVFAAVRKTPGVKNSPWMIPEAAVEQHFKSWQVAS